METLALGSRSIQRTKKEEGEVKRKRKREGFSEEISEESRKGARSETNLQGESRREKIHVIKLEGSVPPIENL